MTEKEAFKAIIKNISLVSIDLFIVLLDDVYCETVKANYSYKE